MVTYAKPNNVLLLFRITSWADIFHWQQNFILFLIISVSWIYVIELDIYVYEYAQETNDRIIESAQ